MSQKIRLGVLFGGRSTEHQVSLVSATSVINALDKQKYDVIPIGITPAGQWLTGEKCLRLLKEGGFSEEFVAFLPADPTQKSLVSKNSAASISEKLDVIFPVLHGSYGEDGTIQGLLELADIPYVGASVLGSSVAMDKIVQKLVTNQAGIQSVNFLWLKGADWRAIADTPQPVIANQLANLTQDHILQTIEDRLGFPVFVKPPNLGSSVGISKARNQEELRAGIETALKFDRKVLVEQAVPNVREIEIAVLGNERPKASIPGEIVPSNEFYDYDAKYVDGASTIHIPANLPEELLKKLQETAVQSVVAIEAEGMSRVDFLVNDKTKEFYLNEVNTIPGFTSISMYPKMWEASGLPYADLLDELVRLAIDRHAQKKALSTTYQPKEDWYK